MPRRQLAAAGLLMMLAGVPFLLREFAGPPRLRSLPDLDGLRRAIELSWVPVEWAIQILALLAWGLWAYLLLAVLLRIAAHLEVRLTSARRVWTASEACTLSPVKVAVDFVVGVAFLSTVTQGSAPSAPVKQSAGWASTLTPHFATLRTDSGQYPHRFVRDCSTQHRHESPLKPIRTSSSNGGYIVRPGDSLWSIAEQRLSDPYRWTEIWQLNKGREMPGGQRLLRPGYIRPGWTLNLPETLPDARSQPADDKLGKKVGRERFRDQQSRAGPDRTRPTVPAASPTEGSGPHLRSEEKPAQRIELPSGTAVALSFIGGFLTAIGLRELQVRRERRPQPIVHGWPRADKRTDLKARLIRSLVTDPEDVEEGELEGVLARGDGSTSIILGHRIGSPVVAERQGIVYAFTGDPQHALSYLRDLTLHSLISTRAAAEVWTTDEVELPPLNGLRAFADPRGLVSELEVEILKRHRMLDEEGLKDWESHQDKWPDDPLPYIVALLIRGDGPLRNRLAAIATQGQELGLIALAQDSAAADAIRVDGDTLQPLGRLEELLGEPFEAIRFSHADREELLRELTPRSESGMLPESPEILQIAPEPAGTAGSLLRVSLFGPPTILLGDEEFSGRLRRKSRELLAFFLLHPQGVGRDQVIDALWPETDPDRATEKFWKQLGDMRRGLRSEPNPTAKFVERSGDIYRVEIDEFDVDVWRFDHLLAAAQEKKSREVLSAAADLCKGELLEGVYYDWAQPLRDYFRNKVVDVLTALAEACQQGGDPEEAARALTRAIGLEPYAEHLYRKLMNAYWTLGRVTDIQRVYRELEAALSEGLEAEPTEETIAHRDKLIQQQAPGGS